MFRTSTPRDQNKKSPSKDFTSDDIFVWENPLQPSPPPSSPVQYAVNMTSSCEEALENSRNNPNASSAKLLFYNTTSPLGKLQEQNVEDVESPVQNIIKQTEQITETNNHVEPIQPWYLEQQEVLYSQPSSGLKLPPPSEFGGGNPFLVLLCVTLLRQHRDVIMQAHMDYNELAMHLDRMVRRHNVRRVLREARALYRDYLAQYGNKSQGMLRNQSS